MAWTHGGRGGWLALLSSLLLLLACGGGGGDGGGGAGDGDGDGDANGAGDGDGDGDGDTGSGGGFSGVLLDNLNEQPIPNVTVKVLDNDTGEELGMETTSEAPDGEVTFDDLPAGKVGFLAVGEPGESIDTYQFNIDSDAQDETLWIVSKSVAQLVPGLADLERDVTKGMIAGALYWVNDAGEEEPVGCATVRVEGEGEVRYFGSNNLPIRDTPVPDDEGAEYRTDSHPLNGRFFIGNADPGAQTITMVVDGEDVGGTTLVLFAAEDSSDGEDSVCISNIYVEGLDENPTPADCE